MTDDVQRRLADIEKRLARLERAAEKPTVDVAGRYVLVKDERGQLNGWQWCECGRDVCRAPDCPSHRSDPMGR